MTEIADCIGQNYFDTAVAQKISVALKSEASSGIYDGRTPEQLATALTTRLLTFDRHFRVVWRKPSGEHADAIATPPSYGPEQQDRRSGYGFRKVETLPGNIGYIDLSSFAPVDFSEENWPAQKAAQAALELVRHTDALIIDLRDNGGGDPSMVGYLASAFVDPKRDIYNVFHGRNMAATERPGKPYAGATLTMPLYILTSGRTGSAAESFAYTLQAAGRATIVGEVTAGAANPGGMIDLPGGYSVFVSHLSPKNPITHGNWESKGVIPDHAIGANKAFDAASIMALQVSIGTIPAVEKTDAQRALEAAEAIYTPRIPSNIAGYAARYDTTTISVGPDGLQAFRNRRPSISLRWIGGDIFFPLTSPNTRYIFNRAEGGRIRSLTISYVDGNTALLDRTDR